MAQPVNQLALRRLVLAVVVLCAVALYMWPQTSTAVVSTGADQAAALLDQVVVDTTGSVHQQAEQQEDEQQEDEQQEDEQQEDEQQEDEQQEDEQQEDEQQEDEQQEGKQQEGKEQHEQQQRQKPTVPIYRRPNVPSTVPQYELPPRPLGLIQVVQAPNTSPKWKHDCRPDECSSSAYHRVHVNDGGQVVLVPQGRSAQAVFDMYAEPLQPSFKCYDPKRDRLRLALVVFATGRYVKMLDLFLSSAKDKFFPFDDVTVFVFTNHLDRIPSVPLRPGGGFRIVPVYEPLMPWPYSSMARFEALHTTLGARLLAFDYVYSHDSDYQYHNYVCDDMLDELVGVIQPQFNCRKRDSPDAFAHERNPNSTAYIAPQDSYLYFHGAQYGGRPQNVLDLAAECMNNTIKDGERGVKAMVDDESHVNRYFHSHRPTKILSEHYNFVRLPQHDDGCWFPIMEHRSKNHEFFRAGDE